MPALCNSQEILIRARIFNLLRSPGIDSKDSIPPTYVAWRAGATDLFLFGSEAPIGCLKGPALVVNRLFLKTSLAKLHHKNTVLRSSFKKALSRG
jgi:hypothetical protein